MRLPSCLWSWCSFVIRLRTGHTSSNALLPVQQQSLGEFWPQRSSQIISAIPGVNRLGKGDGAACLRDTRVGELGGTAQVMVADSTTKRRESFRFGTARGSSVALGCCRTHHDLPSWMGAEIGWYFKANSCFSNPRRLREIDGV